MSSITVKNWTEWLKKSRFSYMSDEQKEQTLRWLFQVRDKILNRANLKDNDTLIDIGTGTGLLAFGAYDILKEKGHVIASDSFNDCIQECKAIADSINMSNIEFLLTDASDIKLPVKSVDVIVMRSVLVHILNKQTVIDECYRILRTGGRISLFEPILQTNTRNFELISPDCCNDYEKYKNAETLIMTNPNEPLTNFDESSLKENFESAGFKNIDIDLCVEKSTYPIKAANIDLWFNTPPSPNSLSLKQRFLQYIEEKEVNEYMSVLKRELDNKIVTIKSNSVYISAEK